MDDSAGEEGEFIVGAFISLYAKSGSDDCLVRKSWTGMAIRLWVILYMRMSLLSLRLRSSLRQFRDCSISVTLDV
jgi:hypothetical protein